MDTSSQNKICVIIDANGEERSRMYHLPCNFTVNELMVRWMTDIGFTSPIRFIDGLGSPIDDDSILSDMQMIAPGMTRLQYEEQIHINIEVYGCINDATTFLAWPSQTINHILPEIIERFALEQRSLRFSFDGEPVELCTKVSSLTKEIDKSPKLLLEIASNIEFHDNSNNLAVIYENLFPSECSSRIRESLEKIIYNHNKAMMKEGLLEDEKDKTAENLDDILLKIALRESRELHGLEESESEVAESQKAENRIDEEHEEDSMNTELGMEMQISGMNVEFNGILSNVLSVHGAPWKKSFNVLMDFPRTITIASHCSLQQQVIEPGETISNIHELDDFFDNALLILDPISVNLKLSTGEFTSLKLPMFATVGDVRHMASCIEDEPSVRLMFKSRLLVNDDAMLCDSGVQSGSDIYVKKSVIDLSITCFGQEITYRANNQHLSYDSIIAYLCDSCEITRNQLSKTILVCRGCKRQLSEDEETFQRIPVDCCKLQSLKLELIRAGSKESDNQSSDKMAVIQQLYLSKLRENRRLRKLYRECDKTLKLLEKEMQPLKNANVTEIEALKEEVKQSKNKLSKMEIDRLSAQNSVNRLQNNITALEANYEVILAESLDSKAKIDDLERGIALLKSELTNKQDDFITLQANYENALAEKVALKAKIDDIEKEFHLKSDQTKKLKFRNEEIMKRIKKLQTDATQFESQKSILNFDIKSLKEKIEELEETIKHLEAENTRITMKNVTLQRDVATTLRTNVDSKSDAEAVTKRLEDRINEMQETVNTLTAEKMNMEEIIGYLIPHIPQQAFSSLASQLNRIGTDIHKVFNLPKKPKIVRKTNVLPNKQTKPIGATAIGYETINFELQRPNTTKNRKSVKLFVFYNGDDYAPIISNPSIEIHGFYCSIGPHIKCTVDLPSGAVNFASVCSVLQPLFRGPLIGVIKQIRGANGAVEVTSEADDEVKFGGQMEFCNNRGQTYTRKEANWPSPDKYSHGDKVLIIGTRRTVLHVQQF